MINTKQYSINTNQQRIFKNIHRKLHSKHNNRTQSGQFKQSNKNALFFNSKPQIIDKQPKQLKKETYLINNSYDLNNREKISDHFKNGEHSALFNNLTDQLKKNNDKNNWSMAQLETESCTMIGDNIPIEQLHYRMVEYQQICKKISQQ